MGLFDFLNPSSKISDTLDKLVDVAEWGSNEKVQEKAAKKIGKILGRISDVDRLHAIYQKQPYKRQAAKELVLQRYCDVINGISDVYKLLKYNDFRKYTHTFSNNASHRIVEILSHCEDEMLLQKILDEDSGFNHDAKGMAKLILTHANMTTQELLEIAKGKPIMGSCIGAVRLKASEYINDLKILKNFAFDTDISSDIMIQSQIKLIKMTNDIKVLEKIKARTNTLYFFRQEAHMIPVITLMVEMRIAELKGEK